MMYTEQKNIMNMHLDFITRNGYQKFKNFSHIFSNYIKLLFELEEYELAEEQLSMIDINNL